MNITRGYKTELDPTAWQRGQCARHAGAARFAFNWGLAQKQAAYAAGEKLPTAIDLHKRLNKLKKTDCAWMYTVSKCAPQEALRDLDQAYAHAFRRVQERQAGKNVKVGFPTFKSKKHSQDSFTLTGAIHVFERHVQLPRLGRLRLKERGYLPFDRPEVKILSATLSRTAERWYVALQVEEPYTPPELVKDEHPVVGVDLGVKTLATVSDGTVVANPRALGRRLRQLQRLNRAVSRKQKGSHNRRKAARRLARAHQKIAHLRQDTLHQFTTWLATPHSLREAGRVKPSQRWAWKT